MPGSFTKMALRLRGARFAIVHEEGSTRLLFGPAAPAFVSACGDLLERAGIEEAWVAQLGDACCAD